MSQQLPEYPDFCWPVDTSCLPDWDRLTDPDQPAGEDNPPLYSDGEKARATALAQQALRMLTGYRVGGCPVSIRPCQSGHALPTFRTNPVAGGGGSTPWHPVSLGGHWLNIGCGHAGACSCTSLAEVRLYGEVSSVQEVRVDGVALDADAYQLYAGGLLVRTDGGRWPLRQNMAAPDTERGTWSITYTPGLPVDGTAAAMAGVMAGEFLKACTDQSCRLPAPAVQIVRQGVTLTLGVGAFPEGKTGIREVDAWLEAVNPHQHASPSTVWSPDLPHHRTQL